MTLRSSLAFEVVPGWGQAAPGLAHEAVSAVDTDTRDDVYLLTRKAELVLVYDRDGRYLRSWGDPLFANVHGLTIGPDGGIWISDNANHTVRKFTPDGRALLTLGTMGVPSDTGYTDGPGTPPVRVHSSERVKRSAGPFNGCTNLAFGPDGDIYVADGYYNARIHRFSKDGELLRSWGDPGSGPSQFRLPHGIAIDRQGRVLVCDRENDRIQLFDVDGRYIAEWTDVQRPTDCDVDSEGKVFVSELWRPVEPGQASFRSGTPERDLPGRLSVLDDRGRVLARQGASSEDREAPGNFVAPHGICVDSRGDVYVCEVIGNFGVPRGISPGAHQIQKLTRR